MWNLMVWNLVGTESQNKIISDTLARTTFAFEDLRPGLVATTGGRDTIPVEWADLSRYGAAVTEAAASGGHAHIHEDGDVGHPIEVRERVLGLAWYSGKVSIDTSLEGNPTLAAEVFLSEGAHMIDFFLMTDRERMIVWNALHPEQEDLPLDTNVEDGVPIGPGEGWFDVGDYRAWIGEAWMGLFVRAYSDYPVTIPFNRPPHDEAVAYTRQMLTPYFTGKAGRTYHDSHRGIKPAKYFAKAPVTLRPCGVCKPS